MSLDTKLELLKNREYAEYTYRSVPDYKDGKYKGQWKNGKPNGKYVYVISSAGMYSVMCCKNVFGDVTTPTQARLHTHTLTQTHTHTHIHTHTYTHTHTHTHTHSGEFSQETTGRLYKGTFKDGKFHGQGELHWFLDKDNRKKYIGGFRMGAMDGHGEMK